MLKKIEIDVVQLRPKLLNPIVEIHSEPIKTVRILKSLMDFNTQPKLATFLRL